MDRIYNVCVIGCGKIAKTRHIPAIGKFKGLNLWGLISKNHVSLDAIAKKHGIPHVMIVSCDQSYEEQLVTCSWFSEIDAVVVSTPPFHHFSWAKACLCMKKHVLVEKPMVMSKEEALELKELAQLNSVTINVMHNFQFSSGFQKIQNAIQSNSLGELTNITAFQFSNHDRRLPEWYEELPFGLFFDEASHFFYLPMIIGGPLKLLRASAQNTAAHVKRATPDLFSASYLAGSLPYEMFINFDSPVCEWLFIVSGTKKIAVFDFFKDICVILKHDGEHQGKEVLCNSLSYTFQYWKGFISSGWKRSWGTLLYGHDIAWGHFINAIRTGNICPGMSVDAGFATVKAMEETCKKAERF